MIRIISQSYDLENKKVDRIEAWLNEGIDWILEGLEKD